MSKSKTNFPQHEASTWRDGEKGKVRYHTSVVRTTLLYISKMLKKVFLRVTLNKVKGLMHLKRRDSSLRSE